MSPEAVEKAEELTNKHLEEDKFVEERLLGTYQEFTPTTAVYPNFPETEKQARVMYVALGLMGEAGEVSDKVKKWYRDGALDHKDMKSEIGDVMYYISQLCNELGYDLSSVLIQNRDKLIDRSNRDVISGSGDNR
ncbi:MAG: nucleoside triphosphate pyrophosphohydrolase family protein [Candidatus Korarchaeota archaeon]|nr:nucleoside triphosphate pyrophosphohydrolase family protein [Candidatus Korarchaeota archaeon]NIU83573.1 hypothetical protein [Candidatus Thorarchaeota archaeon]NIW13521.1 hypothetical protein [Candidatus Thorarchaeota archaeon]NIW53663.1 hypothetical protein [Candidatus Korarchaeota archaeon]